MTPIAKTVVLRALADATRPGPTSRGIIAARAGWLTAANAVCTASRVSTDQTRAVPVSASSPNSREVTAIPAVVTTTSSLRSTRSATAPPHRPKTTSGTRANSPDRPT